MQYIPNTEEDKKEMLRFLGINSIKGLFEDIPKELLIKDLKIPWLSELELKERLKNLSKKNKTELISFMGAGAYNHFIPSVINHIISRSEFYTAYTPYQAEISQGILQAIYEYQTMICELTGMDVANASVYDGATALAEACIMAINITKRNEIIVSRSIHPEYRAVVKTYCKAHNINLVEINFDYGETSISELKKVISDKTAAVLIQNPNFFGVIEDTDKITELARDYGALSVVCVVEATSLGMLKPPVCDIVVGEGQSLGNPLYFGGPYLGFMATKQTYARYLPGRLVGATTDLGGNRGYILTLQAREQHIRRAKATSNICSNEALNALAATVYLALVGKQLRVIAEHSFQKAHYLAYLLNKNGYKLVFDKPFYNEFVIKVDNFDYVNKRMLEQKIILGLHLKQFYPELSDCVLMCVTEIIKKEDIEMLIKLLGEKNGI